MAIQDSKELMMIERGPATALLVAGPSSGRNSVASCLLLAHCQKIFDVK
jgi:hypothetical protein